MNVATTYTEMGVWVPPPSTPHWARVELTEARGERSKVRTCCFETGGDFSDADRHTPLSALFKVPSLSPNSVSYISPPFTLPGVKVINLDVYYVLNGDVID